MKVIIAIIVVAVLGVALYIGSLYYRVETSPIAFYDIKFNEIERVVEQLTKTGGNDGSYAILAFFPGDPNEPSHVELQFSLENGTIGFDWVLLGDIKLRDKDKFLHIANTLGHTISSKTENGVSYLRVEDGDFIELCRKLMRDIYGASKNTQIELVAARFEATEFPLSTMP